MTSGNPSRNKVKLSKSNAVIIAILIMACLLYGLYAIFKKNTRRMPLEKAVEELRLGLTTCNEDILYSLALDDEKEVLGLTKNNIKWFCENEVKPELKKVEEVTFLKDESWDGVTANGRVIFKHENGHEFLVSVPTYNGDSGTQAPVVITLLEFIGQAKYGHKYEGSSESYSAWASVRDYIEEHKDALTQLSPHGLMQTDGKGTALSWDLMLEKARLVTVQKEARFEDKRTERDEKLLSGEK